LAFLIDLVQSVLPVTNDHALLCADLALHLRWRLLTEFQTLGVFNGLSARLPGRI
jgi:hypothetical protein